MLQLRPNCECCNRDLPPAELDAFVRKEEARWMALAKAAGISPE